MNFLLIGSDKAPLLDYLPPKPFLLIDDGPLIDRLAIRPSRTVTFFDPVKHSFNPLKDMSYIRAREFVNVLDAVFPEGETTLTKRYSNFILLQALLSNPASLATLVPLKKDTADAYQKIQTLLLSPVLEPVLCRPTNLSFTNTIIARLDRARLGDFDCFVLANLLISQFQGAIVLPDFGFYAHKGHSRLIRQNRLIAGVNAMEEVPSFRSQLLQIPHKLGSQCTPDDADVLAVYAGIRAGTNGYNDFVEECIHPARLTA